MAESGNIWETLIHHSCFSRIDSNWLFFTEFLLSQTLSYVSGYQMKDLEEVFSWESVQGRDSWRSAKQTITIRHKYMTAGSIINNYSSVQQTTDTTMNNYNRLLEIYLNRHHVHYFMH